MNPDTPFCTSQSGFPCSDLQTTEPQKVVRTKSQGVGESLAVAEAVLMHKASELEELARSVCHRIPLSGHHLKCTAQALRWHAELLRSHRLEVAR